MNNDQRTPHIIKPLAHVSLRDICAALGLLFLLFLSIIMAPVLTCMPTFNGSSRTSPKLSRSKVLMYRACARVSRTYLLHILNRLMLAGAICLGIAAILPFVTQIGGNQLLSSTKLLISVGVVLDTIRQLDAQMVMRNYSGFLS